VRRYLAHAIDDGPPLHAAMRRTMAGADVVLPSRISVGWWFDTPRYTSFFEATILAATPVD
jgi:hypothetical protein